MNNSDQDYAPVTKVDVVLFPGETFRTQVNCYLQNALRKGVPPLFVVLRPLYCDPEKVKIIEDLALSYATNLKETGHFIKGGAVLYSFLFWPLSRTMFESKMKLYDL
jgi:hypothetical protein